MTFRIMDSDYTHLTSLQLVLWRKRWCNIAVEHKILRVIMQTSFTQVPVPGNPEHEHDEVEVLPCCLKSMKIACAEIFSLEPDEV